MRMEARAFLTACAAAWLSAVCLFAQTGNQSSAQSPYFGSVTAGPASPQVRQLSLDDAIRMGIEHNLALVEAQDQEKVVQAQALESLQPLLPDITAEAQTGAHVINLAAFGFSQSLLDSAAPLFPGLNLFGFPTIIRVDTTIAQLNYSQSLVSLTSIEQRRAAKQSAVAAYFNTQSSRGLVVLNVGTAYLEALAAGAQVDDATSLLQADQLVLDQSIAQHQAGTAANLDELRARVQMESQQQAVIAAENSFMKAKIALNRQIGLPAEQEIQLTDAAPYSELTAMNIEEAKTSAYQNRQDYQQMQAEVRAAELQEKAAKWERLPTLTFNGNYGVTGVTRGLYHGTFAATGTLKLPLFEEAQLRGDRDVAAANLSALRQRFASLKQDIDQQLRDSILDLQSTGELQRVARSNVDLAQQELEQTRERFAAGVDDNLPVVQAQATLASAESNLVDTTVKYNESKLGLARNLGIVDTQYRVFMRGVSNSAPKAVNP
jgi:outer membrane protein TolC